MFYNQMRPQQNPNTQIDPNASRQISNRRMQEILEQARLQQMLKNYNPEQYMNLGLFGNTIGAQTHNPLKGQISDREMQMLRKAQQELYFRHLQQLSQQQMQNTKGQISDREMQYFRNQMGN
tara:strand:- start:53 stop:418 length:366 start_codon:yes stop_codon:yes gene_type:complete